MPNQERSRDKNSRDNSSRGQSQKGTSSNNTRGGTREQHREAGRQSHKND